MSDIIAEVTEFLKKYSLEDKTIIIGFSGGFDSMCLLDVLSRIKSEPQYNDLKLVAAHFNHNWRGEESLKEQEICRIFAKSKGIEFYTKTASGLIKKTENDARIARYEFFDEAVDTFDADAVFTAHNYDDNAETLLYRIIKGTGIVGLKGIAEKRDFFYRPLLKIKRSEIIDYCNKNNLTPNNDSSNENIIYKRNYLRLNIIPALAKINPEVKDALNTLSTIANNDNAIITEFLEPIKKRIIKGDTINPVEYKSLSKPIKMRILHEFIQSLELDYDYKKITEIYNFVETHIDQRNGSTKSLASAMWLYVDEKIIEVIPPRVNNNIPDNKEKIVVEITQEGSFNFEDKIFNIKKYLDSELFVFPESTANFAYVDLSNVKFPLTLRNRQDGDIISPFGMYGTMKLKKYFNAKGIQRHKRDTIPLLCCGNEVLWAIGVGLSSRIKVHETPTHVIEIL